MVRSLLVRRNRFVMFADGLGLVLNVGRLGLGKWILGRLFLVVLGVLRGVVLGVMMGRCFVSVTVVLVLW